jgi:hypothetical protein
MLTDLFPQEIGGDEDLLNTKIEGDFIVRETAEPMEIIAGLQQVLEDVVGEPVRIGYRDVEREAVVVRGEFKFTPLDKRVQRVEVFGQQLDKERADGDVATNFEYFLRFLGDWIEMPVVNEAQSLPARINWRTHSGDAKTEEELHAAREPVLVLLNLSVQTNLQFSIEPRKVRTLMVERAATDGAPPAPRETHFQRSH